MADYEDEDLRPRDTDPAGIRSIYASINDSVKNNERTRKALRTKIDVICMEGLKHRRGRDQFDDEVDMLYTRFSIPATTDRKDGHPSSYWRPWVRLNLAPRPKYFDPDSHPNLIATIAAACWVFEQLRKINPNAKISVPSEGILHPALGDGSVARFNNLITAWNSQTAFIYDKTAEPCKPPPIDLYPPPPGQMPIGTEEEGLEAGRLVGRQAGHEAAQRNASIEIPSAPVRSHDGRPYSEPYLRGWNIGTRSTAQRAWDTRRGEIDGMQDARQRAIKDAQVGIPPLGDEDILSELLDKRDSQSQPYKTAYTKLATIEYKNTYARVLIEKRAAQEAREREIRAAEAKARAESEKSRMEAEDRAAKAEKSRREAEAHAKWLAAEAEKNRKEADERARRATNEFIKKVEAETRRVAEAEKRAQKAEAQELKRKAEEQAAAAREQNRANKDKVWGEIYSALVLAGVPKNHASTATAAMVEGAIPHVKIVY